MKRSLGFNAHVRTWLAHNASQLPNTAKERGDWMDRYWREIENTA